MKIHNKYTISLSLLFILNPLLFSQDSLHIGLQIGVNQSSIYGINIGTSPTKKTGYNFGYYLSYPLNRFSDINFELWYIKKGSSWGCSSLSHCDDEYTISYLELPVYYSFRLLKKTNKAKLLSTKLGLYFSYAVSRTGYQQSYVLPDGTYGLEDIIKKYDYGITFSLQWFIIKERGFIRINYDLGLAPIFKTLEGLSVKNGDRSKQRMRSWILFIGYEY